MSLASPGDAKISAKAKEIDITALIANWCALSEELNAE